MNMPRTLCQLGATLMLVIAMVSLSTALTTSDAALHPTQELHEPFSALR